MKYMRQKFLQGAFYGLENDEQEPFLYFWSLLFWIILSFVGMRIKSNNTQLVAMSDPVIDGFHSLYFTHLVCTWRVLIPCVWWIWALKTKLMEDHNLYLILKLLTPTNMGQYQQISILSEVCITKVMFIVQDHGNNLPKELWKYSVRTNVYSTFNADIKSFTKLLFYRACSQDTIWATSLLFAKSSKRWHWAQQS